jgi:orotidine-5'-phosphate decarboxylase
MGGLSVSRGPLVSGASYPEGVSGVGHFGDRLAAAVESKGAPLCVGLDPMLERLPAEVRGTDPAASYELFCRGIVDAVAETAVAVKLQSAFFEALGSRGVAVFERVAEHARGTGLLVVGDVKRGDIPSTADAYAAAFLEPREGEPPLADVITVSPYMGGDSIEPFLRACREHGTGIFCLLKTSNPGSGDVQDVPLADGRPLWHHVAELIDGWGDGLVGESGLSSVGAVVGATHPGVVEAARQLLPHAVLLLLGIGAQGAQPADVAAAFAGHPAGGLVSISRSILYAHEERGGGWQEAAAAEAERLAGELRAAAVAAH